MMRLSLFSLSVFFAAVAWAGGIRRFDFGPVGSAVQAGYELVTPATTYTAARGFGFVNPPQEAGVIDKRVTVVDPQRAGVWRVVDGITGLDALTSDYVAGKSFRFRLDVPNGKYDGVAVLGYKNGIHHVTVEAN